MAVTKGKKTAMIALLTGLSLIAFTIESLLPSLPVPGAKLGLANIFIMLCLIWYSMPEALIALIAKFILSAVFGGFSTLTYSVPAGLISLFISFLLIQFLSGKVSIVAVAALSAIVHNLIQLTVFGLITRSNVTFYLPLLAAAGVVAGVATGIATFLIIKYVPLDIVRKKE